MNNKGFTLLEVLGVLAILVMILSFAVPKIQNTLEKSNITKLKSEMMLVLQELEQYVTQCETFSNGCTLSSIQAYQSPYITNNANFAAALLANINTLPLYLAYEVRCSENEGDEYFQIIVSYPGYNQTESAVVNYQSLTPQNIADSYWPEEGDSTEWDDNTGCHWTAQNEAVTALPSGGELVTTTIMVSTNIYEINNAHSHTAYTLNQLEVLLR